MSCPFLCSNPRQSKIEKVPRGIQGEKLSKEMANSQFCSKQFKHMQVPKRRKEADVRKGKLSLLVCHSRRTCFMVTSQLRAKQIR